LKGSSFFVFWFNELAQSKLPAKGSEDVISPVLMNCLRFMVSSSQVK